MTTSSIRRRVHSRCSIRQQLRTSVGRAVPEAPAARVLTEGALDAMLDEQMEAGGYLYHDDFDELD